MPIIEPANTQQVLQMSSFVEKVQQGQQQIHHSINQYLDEERAVLDEIKRSEVQEAENPHSVDPANPDGAGSGQASPKRPLSAGKSGNNADEPPRKKEISFNKGSEVDLYV